MEMMLQTKNLCKSFKKQKAVNHVSLNIEKGKVYGLLGPNGAGKSTTIRTLLGLIAPTSGEARIFEKDIVKDHISVLEQIGYLPSEAVFYPGMRVKDVLKLSANLRKKDCAEEAKKLCDRLQLDSSRNVDDLSFGNRKKVGIVCALQSNPELLILDEPTSGLDPLMQREFFEILKERNRRGTTVFLSSHVLSEIQRNCTRAAIIREGRLIACDSVEQLSQSNAKRISIHGKVDLSGLDGIRDKKEGEDSVSFLYTGDINKLLRILSAGQLSDISISEPDLEEIFLHYYEKEGENA